MKPAGAVNVWRCDRCGALVAAIHVSPGVTPAHIACRADDCKGTARSLGYPPGPPPDHILEAIGWEWVSPSATQLKAWRRAKDVMYSHALAGGLTLRPLTTHGRYAIHQHRSTTP